uniref:Phage integrase n=1 Tax=mine drainage metagenome TaxID=410659 RepID=E6PQA9_9ZZZZ
MAIRRPKLDRKVAEIAQPNSSGERAPDWSFTIHCPHEGDLVFDFNPYRRSGRDDLAGHMRDAFWSLRHERVGRSLLSYDTHGMHIFWRFLDDLEKSGKAVGRLDQIDRALIERFLAWLEMQLSSRGPTRGQALSLTAKRVSFNHLKALLSNRQRYALSCVSPELSFPRNPFPNTNRLTPRRKSYSAAEQKAIISALNTDLRRIHEDSEKALPALQVLIVHMIVLALAAGWNLQTLIELRRDSLRDHPLTDRKLFVTVKRRGASRHAVSVPDGVPSTDSLSGASTVPATVANHFRFLCDFTAPLFSEAQPRDRDCVFLWRVPKLEHAGQVVRLNASRISNGLIAFRSRHDLRDDRGRPLRLGIARMRPTMAIELYRRTRDIRKVQQALGHASALTTAKHYADKPLEAERDHAFVLDSMVSRLTRLDIEGKVLVAADGEIPTSDVRDLLSGGYNTGIARCRNPFRSDDNVCQKYFTCFRCPNFCVFEDDLWRLFSFYERLMAERPKINPAHWMKTYGPIVRRIDAEIAPLFPSDKVEAAHRLAKESPHPTWRGA